MKSDAFGGVSEMSRYLHRYAMQGFGVMRSVGVASRLPAAIHLGRFAAEDMDLHVSDHCIREF